MGMSEAGITDTLAEIAFNGDGLVPAIAQQHDNGEVLMMAWMNAEAVAESLRTGRVCYFSRSRQALWRKGESSGQTQRLVDFRLDCDGDTVLLAVDQTGVACHNRAAALLLPAGQRRRAGDRRRRPDRTQGALPTMTETYAPPEPEEIVQTSLLTGFLGSGKTTLINALLKHPDMSETAVLVNEFGEIGLDHHLIEQIDEQTVLLNAGCLCCTVRGDLARALRELFIKRVKGEVPAFSRVLVETTGLADPAPIIHTLMTDRVIANRFALDGVVATVDGVNGEFQLDRHPESLKQAAVADRIVINQMRSRGGGRSGPARTKPAHAQPWGRDPAGRNGRYSSRCPVRHRALQSLDQEPRRPALAARGGLCRAGSRA